MTDNSQEKVKQAKQQFESFEEEYEKLQDTIDELREEKNNLETEVDISSSNIDFDKLEEFLEDQYWLINKIEDENYEIYIPSFVDVQAGVLDRQVKGYNVFKLDNITKMISGIPQKIEDEVDISDEQRFKLKGDLLEFVEEQKDTVEEELGEYVKDVKDDKATVKSDKGQALIEELLSKGEIPFTPAPVDEEDLRKPETNHTLRPYQQDAIDEWLEYGAITVCFMTGAGKTHVGIEAFDRLKYNPESGRKAVVAFNILTAIQWKERIEEFAPRMKAVMMSGKSVEDLPEGEEIVEIYTYNGLHTLKESVNNGNEYVMIQFDECDFLGADTYSTASTLPMKYRMGHSASPVRSREHPNKVFALSGKPVGTDWKTTLKYMDMSMFPVNIHVVKEQEDKLEKAKKLLDKDKVTVIVVERTHEESLGKQLSEELGLEFIHGKTPGDPLENINNAIEKDNAVIASRIIRRGASIEGIQRLIEIGRRGDSRRDTIQVIGRLFHGKGEQADLVYTAGEANSFEESFIGILDKEFQINDVDNAIDMPETSSGVIEADFEEIDFDKVVTPNVSDSSDINNPVDTVSVNVDREEFVQDDKIKDEIREWIEDSAAGEKSIKRVIAALVAHGELSREELKEHTGNSSSVISKVKGPLKRTDNPVVKIKDKKWRLNTEKLEEIRESQEKKNKMDELVEDLDI